MASTLLWLKITLYRFNFKISKSLALKISKLQNLKVSKSQNLKSVFPQLLNSMLQRTFVFDSDNGTILCMLYDMKKDIIITAGVGGLMVR